MVRKKELSIYTRRTQISLGDIWNAKSIIFQLAKKDVLVKYKQAFLGVLWSVIQPFFTMIIFTIVFGMFAGLKEKNSNIPYPLIVLSGFLCWQLFSQVILDAGDSLINNAHILKKIYFPRVVFPISSSLPSFLEFLISVGLFVLIGLYYRISFSVNMFLSFLFAFQAYLLALGIGLFVAALNVNYRDFKHIVPVILRLGFYISPVGYQLYIVPNRYRFYFSLNPVVGLISGFRWSLLGEPFYYRSWLFSLVLTLFVVFFGICFFRSMERKFADEI